MLGEVNLVSRHIFEGVIVWDNSHFLNCSPPHHSFTKEHKTSAPFSQPINRTVAWDCLLLPYQSRLHSLETKKYIFLYCSRRCWAWRRTGKASHSSFIFLFDNGTRHRTTSTQTTTHVSPSTSTTSTTRLDCQKFKVTSSLNHPQLILAWLITTHSTSIIFTLQRRYN